MTHTEDAELRGQVDRLLEERRRDRARLTGRYPKGFSTKQVAMICDVTVALVNWWIHSDVLEPVIHKGGRRGVPRRFGLANLAAVEIIKTLSPMAPNLEWLTPTLLFVQREVNYLTLPDTAVLTIGSSGTPKFCVLPWINGEFLRQEQFAVTVGLGAIVADLNKRIETMYRSLLPPEERDNGGAIPDPGRDSAALATARGAHSADAEERGAEGLQGGKKLAHR